MNRDLQGQYAGAVTRGIAFLIDLSIIAITVTLSTWLLSTTLRFVGINLENCPAPEHSRILSLVCNSTRIALAFYAGLFAPVYALFFWTLGGQTPGMGVMGVRVVRLDGKPLNIFNSLRRLVGFGLCILTLGIGFAKILIDNQRQGLHDSIAGTCVIYAWRGEQDIARIQRVRNWMSRRRGKSKGQPTPAGS